MSIRWGRAARIVRVVAKQNKDIVIELFAALAVALVLYCMDPNVLSRILDVYCASCCLIVFAFAASTSRINEDRAIGLLGISFALIGTIDIFHAVSDAVNIPFVAPGKLRLFLWIVSGWLMACTMVLYASFSRKPIRLRFILIVYGAIIITAFLSPCIGLVPPMPGDAGYPWYAAGVCVLMAAAYILAVRKARRFVEAGRYRRRMIAACGLAFLACPLMLFVSPESSAGAPAAQFIRAVSYFLLYKSIVAQSLLMPYRRMFGESRRKRERLEALNAELQAALEEKTVLLKEVHHRVKNNLQLISSLLNLEAAHCENPELSELLRPSQERVSSMALVYEQLIESERLCGIDAGLYAKSLLKSIQSYFPPCTIVEEEYGAVVLSLEQTTSLGLILDEALLNAVKHGLNGDRDRRRVALRLKPDTEGWALLEVEDDGPGLPAGVNPATASSFGLFLIRNLSRQLRGEASWSTLRQAEPRGLRFRLRFPLDEA